MGGGRPLRRQRAAAPENRRRSSAPAARAARPRAHLSSRLPAGDTTAGGSGGTRVPGGRDHLSGEGTATLLPAILRPRTQRHAVGGGRCDRQGEEPIGATAEVGVGGEAGSAVGRKCRGGVCAGRYRAEPSAGAAGFPAARRRGPGPAGPRRAVGPGAEPARRLM